MSLRSWLRRSPQPHSVRVQTEDGEEREIKLSADARNRWKSAEDAITTSGAVSVQCLDEDGAIVRAMKLTTDSEGDEVDALAVAQKRYEKELKGERRELALVLDRYGDRLNEAFERGAQAANVSQENLVSLVSVLTQHLSLAITNLHKISMQYATTVQEAPQSGSDEVIARLIGSAIGGGQAPPPKPNGKAGKAGE